MDGYKIKGILLSSERYFSSVYAPNILIKILNKGPNMIKHILTIFCVVLA